LYLVAILVFCSCFLLVFGVSSLMVRGKSKSVERLMMERLATSLKLTHQVDEELKVLRDQALSGFGMLQRFLVNVRFGHWIRRLLEQADVRIKPGTLVLAMSVFSLTGLLITYLQGFGVLAAFVVALAVGFIPIFVVLHLRARRVKRFEMQFPDAIDLLSRAIRAGHAFNTGMQMVADEMPEPVGKEFRRVFEEQKYGLPLKAALLNLLERVHLLDLRLFVVAILIQRQSGGNLSELLEKISHTVRERLRIMRQLKVHTAQAKLTGIILVCLPPLVGAVTTMLNYEYMKIIFLDPMGIRLLLAAVGLQLVGFLWIRQVVNIKV
jgi:tight adherence protein B